MTGDSKEILTWTVRLSSQQPGRVGFVFALAALAGLGGFFWLGLSGTLVALFAVLGSTAEFWMPLHYRIDDRSGTVRCGFVVSAIEWSDVKQIWVTDEGVKLSPLAGSRRLEAFRGVFLRFSDNRDAVLSAVRERVGNDVRTVGDGADSGGDGGSHPEGGGADTQAQAGASGDAAAGDA